jgi:hypothetical protein
MLYYGPSFAKMVPTTIMDGGKPNLSYEGNRGGENDKHVNEWKSAAWKQQNRQST